MHTKISGAQRVIVVILLNLFICHWLSAATITSTTTGGVWALGATWVGGIAPVSTDDVVIATTGGNSVTLNSAASCISLTINLNASLNTGTFLLSLSGNFANSGTFTSTSGGVTLQGNASQSIAGFTTTGPVSMIKTGGTATLNGNVSGGVLTINGSGGTLSLGTGRTHTFTGVVSLTAGTMDGGSSILNVNATSASAWSGTGTNFVAGTGTVVMGGNAQTIVATTFNNLTLGGTGAKTLALGATTVNGILTIANATAITFTGTLGYGPNATLKYNVGASNRTVGAEWVTPFLGSGGVIIEGTGTITLPAARQLGNNTNVALTISSGATLATGGFGLTFHGDFINNATLTAGASVITIAGTVSTQSISGFTTTGAVSITKTSGTATFTSNVGAASLTVNGSGGTLNLGTASHTFSGNITVTAGTLLGGTSTVNLSGNLTTAGTFTGDAFTMNITGGLAQSIAGFTTTGNVRMTKTANSIATLTGNVNAGALTINGTAVGRILNLGVGLTHTFTGDITFTAGTLQGGSSILNVNSTSVTAWTGTGTLFTANTSTVKFGGGAQTITTATSFYNITLGGSGGKTFSSGTTTITGIMSVENGTNVNTFNAASYTGTSSLVYSAGSANRTVGGEWPAAFGGTGGVVIGGTGTITLNAAKTLGSNSQVPLTINSGSTLATGNFGLTLHGNFVNNGTFTAGSSPIVITGTTVTQTLSGFTTTGLISMTKASGTATLSGNASGGGLTINGTAGILNLGTGLSHIFSGTWTRTAGTLNLGSSNIEFTLTGTMFSGTGGTLTPGTGTVVFSGAGAQTCPILTYYNLTISGSGTKTFATTPTVTNILSIEGTTAAIDVTGAGVVTYGPEATLRYNKATSYTTTLEELPASFTSEGGVIIAGTGPIVFNGAKAITYNLNINTGAVVDLGTFTTHTCRGLKLGAAALATGEYGGTGSGAVNTNPTFFAANTGKITSSSTIATWNTAAGSTNWSTPANWLEGAIPTASTNAIIPGGGTQPTLTAAGVCRSLTIQSGATVTTAGFQLTINGDFINSGTAAFSSSTITIAGLITQSIAGFTTTGTVTVTKTAGIATLAGNVAAASLTVNGTGGTLSLGSATHTFTGNLAYTLGTLLGATSTVNLSGNITAGGIFTGNAFNLILTGTGTQSIPAFTTTGNVSMTKTGGTATFTGAISAGALTINGSGGTLSLGTALSHTFTGDITLSNGTLNGGTSTLNANSSTATVWTGTGTNFTAGTGTVVFGGVAQTINTSTTFNNLTLGGTGAKTFLNGITLTINGVHTISNAANVNVFTGVTLTYGASATLTYSAGASARTVGAEWPTPFTSSGGVVIAGTGAISLNEPKVFNDNIPLTINASAILTQGANLLTLRGNFTRSGTLTSGTGGITLAGIANQNITGGFTTAGVITLSKTGGTATFISGITSAPSLVINGTGGTLALGAFTHVFTGDVTITNGTLDASSATLSIGGNLSRTSGTFTTTGMGLTLTGTAAQSIIGYTTTGAINMIKTSGIATLSGDITAGALTLNGVGGTLNLGTARNHTFTGVLTRTNGTLDCGSSTLNLSVTGSVFSGTGGTFIPNTGTVNYSGAAQTVAALTYYNLTLSGSGVKTTTTGVIVPRVFSLEGTATVSAPFTYTGDATLRYNKSTSYTTTTNEFPATFVGGGGVIIAGAGVISLDAAKTIIAPLSINSGSKIDLGSFTGHSAKGLTLGITPQAVGTYGGTTSSAANINSTFFQTATGLITITNPLSTWLGITTDWNNISNWSGGTIPDSTLDVLIPSGTPQQPTLTATSACGDLTINSGATLTTAGFQLSIYGNFVPTGSAIFSSSNIRIGGIFDQNIGSITTTGNITVTKTGGIATVSGNLNATDLTLNGSGGTFNLGAGLTHTFEGNLTTTAGTLIANSSNIILAGTSNQSIAGFTTTGSVTITKTDGTATLTGNVLAANLTINGSGGTLDLGTASHAFTGNISLTTGVLLGNTSTVTLSGNLTGTETFSGDNFNLILNNTGTQSIAGFITTGTITVTKTAGTATVTGNITSGSVTHNGAGIFSFGTSLTHVINGNITRSAGTLNLGILTSLSLTGNLIGTITGTSVNLEITGTGTQSIAALTTTRNISVTKTGGIATLTGILTAANVTIDGFGGTLNLGLGFAHVFSGNLTINNGTLACSTATVTLSGNLAVNSPGVLDANAFNLTIAGTATQSIAGFTTTGNISMTKTLGTATLTGALTAVNLTLNGLGGTLHLGNSLVHTFSGTWTRTNGTLNGGNSLLNFTASGAFISGSVGSFIPNGGTVNYARSGDQTVGQLTYNNLTVSGSGIKTTSSVTVNGVFSLEGTATLSTGVTYGSSSTLQYNRGGTSTSTTDEFPSTFSGSGGVNIESGTVVLNASKTITGSLSINTGASVDLNGITTHTTNGLNLGGVSQTSTGSYGRTGSGAANIDDTYFSGTTGRITLSSVSTTWQGLSSDWFDPANWDAGVPNSTTDAVVANTGVQPVLNNDAVSRDLTISSGAVLITANNQLTLHRNFVQNGTVSFANSPIVLTGNANQSIDGFTTGGVISVTKLAGTATLQSAITAGGLTINGTGGTLNLGTALTHTISGDIIVSVGTLAGNSSNIVISGTAAAQAIAGFTTTGTLNVTKTSGTATLTGNLNAANIIVNGVGGTLNMGASLTHTITGDITVSAGTFNGGTTTTVVLSGNLSGGGTITGGSMNLTLAGASAQNIAAITTTGGISFIKTALAATLTGSMSAAALTINGFGGSLNMGSFTHTFSGAITLTAGTLNANSSTINANLAGTAWTGAGSNFVAGSGTVVLGGVAQTINTTTTFNHLTFGGTGAKTIVAATVTTVNGILTIANTTNTNVFSGTLTYGANATLRYNAGASNRAVLSAEWPSPFTATGGVIIDGTGIITLNAAKQIGDNTNVPLTINSGAILATGNFGLTFHGDFIRSGTLTAGSSAIVIDGTVSSQSIAGFTTTGSFSLAKTTGTATLTSALSAGSLLLNVAGSTLNMGTLTHSFSGDIVRGGGTIAATAFNISLIGTGTQSIETFTTTGALTMAKTAGTATLTGAVTLGSLILNGSGGTLNTGTGFSHSISGDITLTTGILTGSSTLVLSGNLTGTGTFTGNATNLTLSGTTAQNIGAYTTTGTVLLAKTAQVATATANLNAAALTINGSGGTLNLGTSRTHTFTGDITLTNGILNGGSSILNVNASTTTAWNGTGTNFTANTGTVVFGGNAQTIQTSTTFNNLTIQGAGSKTFGNGTTTTINGIFTIANATHTNTFTGASIAYGASASLLYSAGVSSRTVSSEWPSSFTASGGVTIGGTGTITLNAAKQIGSDNSAPLIINSGSTLATNNFSVTLHGDFTRNGTFTAGSSAIILGGTVLSQTISGFTTTGNVSMTKTDGTAIFVGNVTANSILINGTDGSLDLGVSLTHTLTGDLTITTGTLDGNSSNLILAGTSSQNIGLLTTTGSITMTKTGGTATFTGDMDAGGLVINGVGGTLNLGSSRTHSFAGDIVLTSGTLNGGVGTTINVNASTVSAWSGTGSNFTANTGTVSFGGGNQTIATATTFNNLSLAAAGTKTLGANIIVSGVLDLIAGDLAIESNTLTLNGTISSMGSSNSLIGNGFSNIIIGGSGALGTGLFMDQTTPGTTNRIANLTYNRSSGTLSLGNTMEISGTLTPTAGTLASGGNLVLVSTIDGTARIASGGCTTCSYITGNVIVQRYIPSTARRFRFMGSTVQSTTLADWKNETYITGPGGAGNGFDPSGSNAPSVYWYNEALITGDLNIGWTSPANTSEVLTPGKGYRIFVRGDRSNSGRLNGTVTDQNEVTLNVAGVPNQGNITVPISFTSSGTIANDGWNLVSNPFASPYDWNAHYDDSSTHSKLEPFIMIYSALSGGYVSFNTNSDAGSLTNGIIPAGASFWVKANATGPTLVFKEQYKIATNPISVFKTNAGENFNIQLYYDSITYDHVTVKYVDGTLPTFDSYDISNLTGAVTISAYGADGIQLALSCRPLSNTVDTIKLNVGGAAGAYSLKFTNSDKIAVAENVWLFDTYTSTIADLKITDSYNFNIVSGIAASQGLNRFYIIVGNSLSLPVKLVHFTAQKTVSKQVVLNWATAQEMNSKSFEVERAADGLHFASIATIEAGGNTHKVINYSVLDATPLHTNYYRLKQMDWDGTISYSSVRYIGMDEIAVAKLYPIPAHASLTIEHTSMLTNIRISDISGRLLNTQNIFSPIATLDVSGLETGIYIIEYTDESGKTYKEKFTKE